MLRKVKFSSKQALFYFIERRVRSLSPEFFTKKTPAARKFPSVPRAAVFVIRHFI